MSVSGSDLQGLTFLIGNLLNTHFHQWLLSFRNVPGISISLSGVTCLEDFAAEMEEVCIQLHPGEGAGRKSRSQGVVVLFLPLLHKGKQDQELGFKGV